MRSSVALILLYDGQIFMITRKNDVPSFPGYASFPGGLIDRVDEQAPDFEHHQIKDLEQAHKQALRREMIEELQFDIANVEFFRFGLLGSATTPSFNPYRFETFFYFAECINKPDLFWIRENWPVVSGKVLELSLSAIIQDNSWPFP
jgi:8-oxo-dGTP pyrophosphatase MutT (NUDIX family)